MSSYDALAASYDGLMADGVYLRRAAYLERLFRRSAIPVRTVLDLGCGTGPSPAFYPSGDTASRPRTFPKKC